MTMTINTNMASLNAQRNLSKTQGLLDVSMQRLSSGLRINGAKDDAAGLAISTRFTAQIKGLNQSVRNANDGISLLQTAEGAMQETTNLLQRMREIAVQASNDTYSDDDRTSMQNECAALGDEIDRIASDTKFNNIQLLDGTSDDLTLQVGADSGQTISIALSGIDVTAGTMAVDSGTVDLSDATAANALMDTIDTALTTVSTARADLGAIQNRLESTISNLMNVSENLSAANGRIVDADFAAETANMTKQQILSQAGVAMLAQAKQVPQQVLELLK
jgi:flagellin